MSWGAPVGNGKIVKIGDPAKEGFQTDAQGVYLGRRPGEYNNMLYDFATPEGQITVPGSAAIDNTVNDGMKGKLIRLVYEGEVMTKKGKPMKKISVYPWTGPLPAEYADLVSEPVPEGLESVPAALKDDDDGLPF